MARFLFACVASALLTAGSGALAASTEPGGDINALPTGPKSAPAGDSQRDAEAAFGQARAECRRVNRDERRACIVRAQRDYDKTRRQPVPPRPSRRNVPAGG
jgi:hypothetical protein